jgi:hypothetical protein
MRTVEHSRKGSNITDSRTLSDDKGSTAVMLSTLLKDLERCILLPVGFVVCRNEIVVVAEFGITTWPFSDLPFE